MDEITAFTELRPTAPSDADRFCGGARQRLDRTLATATPARPARTRRRVITFAGAGAVVTAVAAAVVVAPALSPGTGPSSFVTAAYAVQRNADGTVTLTIRDFSDPKGLQRTLRADGIMAIVATPPLKRHRNGENLFTGCSYATNGPAYEPARIQRAVVQALDGWGASQSSQGDGVAISSRRNAQHGSPDPLNDPTYKINPGAMPRGSVLFISDTVYVIPASHYQRRTQVIAINPPAVLRSHQLPPCIPFPTKFPKPTPSTAP